MEGRCINEIYYEIYGFLEKWFLDEAIIQILYEHWSIWYIFQLDFGQNRAFSELIMGILSHYFVGVGR